MTRMLVTGDRVALRRIARGDERELRALRKRSWNFLAAWEPRPDPGATGWGPDWFENQLVRARRRDTEKLVLCRRADRTILGMITLNEIVRGAFQSAFLGYWIGAEHARQGFMHEGVELALDHAFGALGLHRVEANIRPENTASLALVRGLGFRHEGLARRYLRIDGQWRDHEHWALTVEDRAPGSAAR